MGFFDDIVNTVTSVSTEAVKVLHPPNPPIRVNLENWANTRVTRQFTVQTAQEVGNVAVQSAVSASEAVVKVCLISIVDKVT